MNDSESNSRDQQTYRWDLEREARGYSVVTKGAMYRQPQVPELKGYKFSFNSHNDIPDKGLRGVTIGKEKTLPTKRRIEDDGEVSMIIDEDLTNGEYYHKTSKPELSKQSTAKEYPVEQEHSQERREEKKIFRIKKEKGGVNREAPKEEMMTTSNNFRLTNVEGMYPRGKKEAGKEQRYSSAVNKEKEPFKEMSIGDKIKRQLTIEQDLKMKYTSFYNSRNTSKEKNVKKDKLQNNFIRTGGFTEGLEEIKKEINRGSTKNDNRKYERPWLKNTAHDFEVTQNVQTTFKF